MDITQVYETCIEGSNPSGPTMEKKVLYHTRRFRCPTCSDDRLTIYDDGTGKCIDGHVFEHEEETPPHKEVTPVSEAR